MNTASRPLTDDDAVAIPFSRRKMFVVLLLGLVFVGIGLFLWSIADVQQKHAPVILKGIGIVVALFFGALEVGGVVKLFDTRPGLVVDRDGIVIPRGWTGMERIRWDEISEIAVSSIQGQDYVSLIFHDPDACTKRGNVFVRIGKRITHQMMGTPINLSANPLQVTFDELYVLLVEKFEQHAGNRESTDSMAHPAEVDGVDSRSGWNGSLSPGAVESQLENSAAPRLLDWSNNLYKFTLGIGSLAMAGLLSEFDRGLPFWAVLLIVLPPLALFIVFRPGDFSSRIVGMAQVIGSVWYIVVATGLLSLLAFGQRPPVRGWQFIVALLFLGYVPCGVALYRIISDGLAKHFSWNEHPNDFE